MAVLEGMICGDDYAPMVDESAANTSNVDPALGDSFDIIMVDPKRKRMALAPTMLHDNTPAVLGSTSVSKNGPLAGSANKVAEIKTLLNYDGFVNVDCVGHSGGLALLWKGVSSVNIISSCSRYIDVEVDLPHFGISRLTGFYGEPNRNRRNNSWQLLRVLASHSDLPWLCLGDFNDILGSSEKRGGRPHPTHLIRGFQAAISDAHLYDFPMSGYAFTWEHGRTSGNLIEEKLDRILTTDSWRRKFSHARAMVLDKSSSDHLPIYLELRHFMPRAQARRFRFENSWRREAAYGRTLALGDRLSFGCRALLEIGGKNFRRFQKAVNLRLACYHQLLYKRLFLRTAGEYMSRFFGGQRTPVLTEAQNEFLLAPYSIEDVRVAVFDMKADKAPGLDGFNPGFYQGYWDVIGNDIAQNCIEIIHSGSIPAHLNETGLVLIPKTSSPESMSDLRPIALCNVLLKIITKMLALRTILPLLISESQCAFVAGRNIQDNCIVAFEALHAFHRKTRGSDFSAAVKMDISKAYDRMEWSFLRLMLANLGFNALWINLIMSSLTSVKYWILQNNRELGPILPTRGLR
ncbi:uncharacterized protein LOC119371427 [Jatropha curcas]|uniref:uncharacterized protein LOC119371427 n=1 Tax=Jatropha curcas TaxID=180498 RepID=UPI001895C253|nr:uncharacterized protein LOC119371427 [Jatropha curcas]